ncbi:hypothetical protein Tco_1094908 [Tanacetum coccineum]
MSNLAKTIPIVSTVRNTSGKEKAQYAGGPIEPREARRGKKQLNTLSRTSQASEGGQERSRIAMQTTDLKKPKLPTVFSPGLGHRERGLFDRVDSSMIPYPRSAEDRNSLHNLCESEMDSAPRKHHRDQTPSQGVTNLSKSEDNGGGHWKSKSKWQRSSIEDDDLSQPWLCEEIDPFTPRHNKVGMMGNSDLVPYVSLKSHRIRESIQKKYIKDPVEIHNIKQREGESTEEFMERFKVESRHVKGASKCMRISRFMHYIKNSVLIKHLNNHIPKSIDEMRNVTTAFIKGEVAATSKKKGPQSWKHHDAPRKQNFERKPDFRN